MRSISMESTTFTRGLPSSVWVVSPEPKPMLAISAALGFIASGSAAASIIVASSTVAPLAASSCTLASALPLVRMLRMPLRSTTEMVAVLPSR
jgi:hypothetical protein